jgi:ankyrin repeat protein
VPAVYNLRSWKTVEKEFIRAAKNGDTAKIQELLALDPGLISVKDAEDGTALHFASWKGHVDAARALLAAGADVNAHSKMGHWGTTPLHAAAHGNQRPIAELLIEHGADVNALDSGGKTPLYHTTIHNATAAAKVLKLHGGH